MSIVGVHFIVNMLPHRLSSVTRFLSRLLHKRRNVTLVALIVYAFWTIFNQNYINHRKLKTGTKYITLESTKLWGVGNQMFGIAAMIGINKVNNYSWEYCLPCPFSIKEIFELDDILCCNARDLTEPTTFHEDSYAEFKSDYNQLWRHSDLKLAGFFQSWKYFNSAQIDIQKHLKFKREIFEQAKDVLRAKLKEKYHCQPCHNITLIALHVRRGDYLHKDSQELGYKVAPTWYIRHAMDHMLHRLHRERPYTFLVTSDDIEWRRYHLGNRSDVIFLSPKSDLEHKIKPVQIGLELAMLSMCHHSIMTVGTFGWWAAYLAGGHTVFYKDSPARLIVVPVEQD
ncbi:hypothetical protein CAPTEDRAFT_210126 [Capitella teleta]|uniref:L-Fucosyltransferase n=1 Tax=Capitella teleta TaxID=283909 RepID=R7TVJ3_CAPTE|nr:hypothetical protein CAPTEDRAFT_210126 [Capitella teleta]|eukprot:ELT97734.1 hypothetical protein CAPTEDRAFT_210126 [Capitella teleta]